MNTIPKPWHFFSDSAYFDKWAIQHKERRSLYQTLHVNTKGEAEYLVERLNALEFAERIIMPKYDALKAENAKLKKQLAAASAPRGGGTASV